VALERTSRAYQLFKATLDRSPNERAAFLAAEADPEIAALVAKMLTEYSEQFEVGGWVPKDLLVLSEWARSREGTVVAGWRIEDELPSGGYGRVYRASRCFPRSTEASVTERAAIKFLDMAPSEIQRFQRERQFLADLDHEGICRFIDGGTTDGGVPFLVMEYVCGVPINRYCDLHRLTVTNRLKLFMKLCEAVEYAHQQGLLHRDLKPGNVLVTLGGAVRVLDFGVAKILNSDKMMDSILTRPGEALGTKCFASPEQVSGGALSFATDVYALGVMLYDMLTGQLPLPPTALSGSDWRQVLAERDPLPPSQILMLQQCESSPRTFPLTPETAASLRGVSQSRLKRLLAGDLDAVVLKALRKKPSERYMRVEDLRLELERFVIGLPVTVRCPSLWERGLRWANRNRTAAVVVAGATLLGVGEFARTLPGEVEYQTALRSEDDAIRRMNFLAAAGLPSAEVTLPPDHSYNDVRRSILKLHSGFLRRAGMLPDYALKELDYSLAVSALECGRRWKDLGELRTALETTTPFLPRVARRVESDLSDRSRRELYAEFLRQRLDLHGLLNMDREAADDASLLSAVDPKER
jgi:serine/threonine protein kinase